MDEPAAVTSRQPGIDALRPVAQAAYTGAEGFPHTIIDGFLPDEMADAAAAAFPAVDDGTWINYLHFNERKFGLNKLDQIPVELITVIEALSTPEFVAALEAVTGIDGLMADPTLEGGGLHQAEAGGFLNMHADFTVHPHQRTWRRRVNLLLYLNPAWEESYGGHLEMWSADRSSCFERILPAHNRCVIFSTGPTTYHGHPHPLTCPDDVTRKSIALYYFIEQETAAPKGTAKYLPLPGDSRPRRVLIRLDNLATAGYSRVKGALGLNDDLVSRVAARLLHRRR